MKKARNKTIKILCTLGPSSMSPAVIRKFDELGVDIFRINLSHTKEADVKKAIEHVLKYTKKPLCLDLEGAQIRSGAMISNEVYIPQGKTLKIHRKYTIGDADNICLTPDFVLDKIEPGDLISVDFDTLLLQVTDKTKNFLTTKVVSGGFAGSNKAVTVDRPIALPPYSKKDECAVKLGLKYNVPYVALSFANRKSDVAQMRKLIQRKMKIISKIESKEGLKNLDDILSVSDAVLLDRGDMSREVAIEMLPSLQKKVIGKANDDGIPVYVATNLLESMVNKKVPTRAEVNDIINTLLDGADGLVLAAETAIGKHPVECVSMVKRLIKSHQAASHEQSLGEIANHKTNVYALILPHGGALVSRLYEHSKERLKSLRKLYVDESVIYDAEQIASGSYSPLEGFMDRREIDSVLNGYRLSNGAVWTLPIVLPAYEEAIRDLRIGDEVALVFNKDEEIYAVLHLEDIYEFDFRDIARRWYQTTDISHPGVSSLKSRGSFFLGGKIDLVKRVASGFEAYTLTPAQTRHIFEKKGWSTIVGFHTRNVPHRAHEYLQLEAIKRFNIDGLFIHPIVGPKKKNDYKAGVILKTYDHMVEKFYPQNNVLLGAFLSYSRYAGPREAVFTALCRKNFGCTHFIVGRDHTGVSSFYGHQDAHALFDKLGDIGIKPVYFGEVYYCRLCETYVEACKHKKDAGLMISGTQARDMFQQGRTPPDWFMRKEISKLVLSEMKTAGEVFVS